MVAVFPFLLHSSALMCPYFHYFSYGIYHNTTQKKNPHIFYLLAASLKWVKGGRDLTGFVPLIYWGGLRVPEFRCTWGPGVLQNLLRVLDPWLYKQIIYVQTTTQLFPFASMPDWELLLPHYGKKQFEQMKKKNKQTNKQTEEQSWETVTNTVIFPCGKAVSPLGSFGSHALFWAVSCILALILPCIWRS